MRKRSESVGKHDLEVTNTTVSHRNSAAKTGGGGIITIIIIKEKKPEACMHNNDLSNRKCAPSNQKRERVKC